MVSSAEVILKTLLYFDIFDYPLKKEEIFKYAVENNFSQKETSVILQNLQKKYIAKQQSYFFLKGREEIVNIRKERLKISLLKLKKAKRIIKKITFIPSIKFIGISGALSMENAGLGDDIDIFVITEKNLVWTTRVLIIIILKFLGVYRSKNDKSYSDKICLNMIIAEDKLSFEKNKNLYTAHEIVQLVPVFNKDKMYEKFTGANSWIKDFLPNSEAFEIKIQSKDKSFSDKFWIFIFNTLFFEKLFKLIQFNYMKRDIKKEVIREGFLGFHPFDYKTYAVNNYVKKLKEYNLK